MEMHVAARQTESENQFFARRERIAIFPNSFQLADGRPQDGTIPRVPQQEPNKLNGGE